MLYSTFVAIAVLALSEVHKVAANTDVWFMDFTGPIAREQLDPVVSPNVQSSHMHRIFGPSNFGASYNFADYESSSCTTAPVQADKSAYWAPQLYYIDTDASGKTIYIPLQSDQRVYYNLYRNSANETVSPFPEGLRMLTGNPNNKSPDTALTYSRYVCQRTDPSFSDNILSDNFNFNNTCQSGMKSEIRFPPCWDGINLYKSDGSHVAFPGVGENFAAACPWTHPVRIPGIQFEITWHPERWSSTGIMNGHLIWANGDTTGYGLHADFVNGWETDVLASALTNPSCVGGQFTTTVRMDTCPVLAASYSNSAASACTPAKGVLQEPLGQADNVPVSALPGCNLPWGATGSKPTCATTTNLDVSAFTGTDGAYSLPSSEWSNLTLPTTPGWNYLGCSSTNNVFNNQISYYDTSLTPERCQATCLQDGLAYSAVAPIPSFACFCGSSLLNSTAFTDGCTSTCPGDSTKICGGSGRSSIYYAPLGTLTTRTDPSLMGCYNSPNPNTAGLQGMTDYSFTSSSMTNELCEQSCVNRGSTFAFTSSNYCYCGTVGTSYSRGTGYYKPDDFCTTKCPGNSTQSCGGLGLFSVYNLTTGSVTSVNVSSTKPAGWQGCYNSASSSGTKSLTSLQWQDNSIMTPQVCINGCAEYGYSLAAVQLGNRCNCGNAWAGGTDLPASQCNTACVGNSSLTCGSTSNSELYSTAYATDTVASIAATKAPGYLACYYTPSSTDGYNDYTFTSNSMTSRTCLAGCAEMGYAFAAPQAGNKCKCAAANTTAAAWPHTYCNSPCKGNTSETCGGSFYSEGYDISQYNASTGATDGSVGCYTDNGTGGGASYSFSSSTMTIELCTMGCKQGNYPLAILGNGKTCYCSSSWGGGKALPSSQCSTACTGNSSEICGGGTTAANLYNSSVGATPPVHNITGWLGCYKNPSTARALSDYTYASTDITPQLCQANCAARGYTLAGIWQGNQCSCGNSTTAATAPSVFECTTACYGDSSNFCGSSTAMDIYNSTSTSTGSTSTSIGCYSDVSTLSVSLYSSDYMTNDICAAACATAGYTFSGTYASTTCRCGNTQPKTLAASARCTSACAGVPTEICGGPAYVTVSKPTSSAVVLGNSTTLAGVSAYYGCYNLGSTKMLSAMSYSSTSMTNAQCVANCKGLGYAWAGTYNAKYCYCDNNITLSTGNRRVLSADCNLACAGNSSQACGSSSMMNLFNTVESTTPALTGSTVAEGMIGCYAAGTQATAAPYFYKGTVSASTCRRSCRIKGYTLAAMFNGLECTCSNDYSLLGAVQPLSSCATVCNGNSSEICGSGTALSVYDTTGAGSLPPTTGYQNGYVGCFGDGDIVAKSTYKVATTTMSITSCASICSAKGASIYGVNNGNTCYCATSMPVLEYIDSACATACPGASSQICGGSGKLSMYSPSLVASMNGATTSSAASASASASASANATVSAATSSKSSVVVSSSTVANATIVSSSAIANATSNSASRNTTSSTAALSSITSSVTATSAKINATTTTAPETAVSTSASGSSKLSSTSTSINATAPLTASSSAVTSSITVLSTSSVTSNSSAAASSTTLSGAAALANDKSSSSSASSSSASSSSALSSLASSSSSSIKVVPTLTESTTTTASSTATSSATISSVSSSRNATSSSASLSSSSAGCGGVTVTVTDTVTQTVTDTVTGTASVASGGSKRANKRKRPRLGVNIRLAPAAVAALA